MITVRLHFLDEAGNEATKDNSRSHPCIWMRYAFETLTDHGETGHTLPIEGWAQIDWPGHDCEILADRIPAGVHADRLGATNFCKLAIEFLDATGTNHVVPVQATVMVVQNSPPFDVAIGRAFFLDAHRWEDERGGSWLTFRPPPPTYLDFV